MQPARAIEETHTRAPCQLRELTLWVGDGRALTQTGRIRLADARELVGLLGTRDALDPMNGRFHTTSSADLPGSHSSSNGPRLAASCGSRADGSWP